MSETDNELNSVEEMPTTPTEAAVEVSVQETSDGNKVNLTLNVAEEDMGMVIGKHGKIAKAIRTVMRAAASADGKDVNVEIR